MSRNDLSAIGLLMAGTVLLYAAGEARERALVMALAVSAVFPVSAAIVLWRRKDEE